MKFYLKSLIFFFGSCFFLFGQYNFLVTQISTDYGLSQSQVMALCQDKTGFLWIGTRKGINRFDGRKMTQFYKHQFTSFPDNAIRTMEITENNRLWVGTERGLFAWDLALNGEVINEYGPFLIDQIVYDINITKEKVWIASQNGITVFDDFDVPSINQFTEQLKFFNDYSCFMISSVNDSLLLVSTHKQSLYKVTHNGKIISIEGSVGIVRNSNFNTKNGKLLICSTEGIGEINNETVNMVNYDVFGPVWDIEPFENGYFVSSMSNGLFLTDNNLSPLFNFETLGIPRYIKAFYVDNNGIIWVGTDGSGLFRISRSQFQSYTTDQGLLDNVIWSVQTDTLNNKVYVGTWGGLMIYENGKMKPSEFNKKIDNLSINAIDVASDGNLIIGNDYNVNIISRDGAVSDFLFHEKGSMIHTVKADNLGRVWVGSEFSPNIARYENGTWKRFEFGNNINQISVKDFEFTSDGKVWVISDKYAAVKDGITWTTYFLHGNTIYDMEITSNESILVGTDEGVWEFIENEFVPNTNEIPENSSVYFIKEDFDSNLWFGTDQGVYKQTKEKVILYTSIDGLAGDETNARAAAIDKEGKIWIGTVNGVSRYTEFEVTQKLIPISYFQNLETSDTTIVLTGKEQKIVLQSGSSFYRFNFGGIFLNQSKPLNYGIRLSGFNEDWTWSKTNEIVYGALHHGDYNFQIQAQISNEQKSDIASINIKIIEPVLERTEVIFLLTFIFIGIILLAGYFIYKNRVRLNLTRIEIYLLRDVFTVILFGKIQKSTIIPSNKLRTFFEVILLHSIMENKGIEQNKLTRYFWDSGTPAQLKNRRNVAITKIRTALMSKEIGSIITVKDQHYEFSVPKNLYYCDVQDFIENYYSGKSAEKMEIFSDAVDHFTKAVTLFGTSGLLNEIDNPKIINYSNQLLEMARESADYIVNHKDILVDERTLKLCKNIRKLKPIKTDDQYD